MNDVELIKSKIDIVEFVTEYVTLKKAGRNFKACCPFHNEKTPSFVVSPERGTWHCFGACNEGGDAITFLQKWENLEFVEALQILAQRVGVTLSHQTQSEGTQLKDKLYALNRFAAEFYHYILTKHTLGARGREYLQERGIKPEIIETFSLGYAPNSWNAAGKYLLKKGYTYADLTTAGLCIRSPEGTHYDRFRGRLMFTLKDPRGNIVGFSGRILPPASEKEAKYVNSPETPVYIKGNTLYGLEITKESIKKEKEAIIVEGEFDFLSSFQSGVSNIVAIKGSALTEGQVVLLKRYTENILLALDGDFAGNEAARRGIEVADAAGLTIRVVKLVAGKDPAECIQQGPHLWKQSIKEAIPIYDFIIDTALQKYDKNDVIGKKNIGNEVIPFLAKISNAIVQSHYIRRIAKELQVAEESIQLAITKTRKKEKLPRFEAPSQTRVLREELLEDHLLSLIIQSPQVGKTLSKVLSIVEIRDLTLPPVIKILEQLSGYCTSHETFDVKEFGAVLTPEIAPTFDKAFLVDISGILGEDEVYKRELEYTAYELKKLSLRRTIQSLTTKIKQADQESDENVLLLHEELRNTLQKIQNIEESYSIKVK